MKAPKPILVMDAWAILRDGQFVMVELACGKTPAIYNTRRAALHHSASGIGEKVIRVRVMESAKFGVKAEAAQG